MYSGNLNFSKEREAYIKKLRENGLDKAFPQPPPRPQNQQSQISEARQTPEATTTQPAFPGSPAQALNPQDTQGRAHPNRLESALSGILPKGGEIDVDDMIIIALIAFLVCQNGDVDIVLVIILLYVLLF